MSAVDSGERQQDAYTRMWETYDNEWNFDDLDGYYEGWHDRDTGWHDRDTLPGSDHTLSDFDPLYAHPDRSPHLPHHPPPSRHSQETEHPREQASRAHDASNATSQERSSNHHLTSHAQPSQPVQPPAPPLSQYQEPQRSPQYSENWLENPGRGEQSALRYIPDDPFATLSDTSSSRTETPAQRPPRRPSRSGEAQEQEQEQEQANDMPSATRRRGSNRNSIVDLTAASSPAGTAASSRAPRSLKRSAEDVQQGHSTKKAKPSFKADNIDELDLTNEAPSAEDELRQTQQEKAIAAQQASDEPAGPLKIGQRQCIICMEPYTNATVTQCGHIYCHECLTQALVAGEKSSDRGTGNCPVCRKPVNRKKTTQMIPLSFMKKSAFKGRGKARKDMGLPG